MAESKLGQFGSYLGSIYGKGKAKKGPAVRPSAQMQADLAEYYSRYGPLAAERQSANATRYAKSKRRLNAALGPFDRSQAEVPCYAAGGTYVSEGPFAPSCFRPRGSVGTGRSPLAKRYRGNLTGCEAAGGTYTKTGSCRAPVGQGKRALAIARAVASRSGSPRASLYDAYGGYDDQGY
jgi:hypothetical protein